LETIDQQLRIYAEELHQYYSDQFSPGDYEEFLRNMYNAQVRTHGEEAMAYMSSDTIIKVIKMQIKEMIRVKSLPRLMQKRDRI